MEFFKIDGVDVKIKRIVSSGYSYRYRQVENALYLNVPPRMPLQTVYRKAEELVADGRRTGKFNRLEDGGSLRLFGETMPVKFVFSPKISVGEFDGEIVFFSPTSDVDFRLLKAVKVFYEKKLNEYLKKRIPVLENYIGIKCEKWKIANLISVWGNCNYMEKTITFSTGLATQNLDLIDMTIIHELAHIRFHDHGKEFHDFMEKYVPGHREKLRRMQS